MVIYYLSHLSNSYFTNLLSNSALGNWRCSLSKDAAYTQTFTVFYYFITSGNKDALSMWPPSICLGMFASLVRYVALIMFFLISAFFSPSPCTVLILALFNNFLQLRSHFVVVKTFVIFAIKFNSGHISTREPTYKYCQKKKYRIQQCVR